ncbi:uncharacterized protein LOC130622927 [Hydractinia symbiolongicarpus]|uniref:uncharacterized protein LOC130622927 n=1 Tax=Hydractinia symbiolongicarpus TaxID=13093 RepID=UPI00254B9777|nr:uncharacterized protein LOC130622927 [Hydractinia symbiolongicarpus]
MHKSVTIYCVLTWWLLVQCKTTKKVNPPAVHHNEYEVVDFMQAVSLKNKKEMAQQTVSSKQSEVKERKGTQHKKTINKTTHTKGNIVEAAKRDASGQAVVQFLDGLAHNTQTVTSFGNCAVTKQSTSTDCKAEYKPNGDCSFLAAFQGIFKDLSQEKMAKFMRAGMSRNIIQGNKFKITANSKIKITTCDNRKKLILYGFGADSVSPLPWLTLRAVTMKRAFVFYEDMANKDNVEDWTGLGFAGSATTDLSGGDARVKILKELKRNQGGDADVVLSIDTERNDITVVHFLTWLGQDVSSLYPETGIDASVMEIDTTHVEKGDGPLVKVILGNENLWEAFVTGKARGSSLLENADKFFVYCKNGDMDRIGQVACAVLAKFTPGSFQWGLTTSGFDVDASALTRPILEAMKESGALLFQSSRDGFQTVADEEVEKEISPYAHAIENGTNVVTEYEASPEMCVRFRLNNFQTKFPEFESKEPLNTLIAHVCPFRQEVRLHLPKIAANDVAKYSSLTMLVVRDIPGPEFGIRNNAYVKIKNIVIRRTEVCQSFTLDGKYQMLNKEGAVEIKDITFKQCYDGSIWSLSGNGKETILNAQADVQVIQKSTRFAITGTLNIFDAKMIQEQTGTSYLKPALQSDLINLMEFPMSDLRFEAFFKKRNQLL